MLEVKMTVVRKRLLEYASLTEGMIRKSTQGLLTKNDHMLGEVVEKDEPLANDFEIELDELVTGLIAQFEPKAKDLRTVLMMLKMSNDLERMGDHAVNIAESGLFLIDKPAIKPLLDIPRMAEFARQMLDDGVQAFIREDVALARSVCERDGLVDGLRDQILRELITFMASDPATIERAIHLLRVASNLERVADLSTNICEDVIFMVEGRVIKHHQDERAQL